MAARFLVPGGNGLWNSTTNWSATSGGAPGASVPVAADTVTLNSASGSANITINVASACTSIIATSGYTGTLTINSDSSLTVSSTVTFISTMGYAGTGTLILAGTASHTSGGKFITGTVNFNSTVTHTLLDTWNVDTVSVSTTTGTVTVNSAAGIVINANSLNISSFTSGTFTGTTKIILVGTGAVSCPATWASGSINIPLDINSVSTTFTGTFRYLVGPLKYTAGTVDTTSATLITPIGTTTFDTSGMVWDTLRPDAGSTITTSSFLNCNNFNHPGGSSGITISAGSQINAVTFRVLSTSTSAQINGGSINVESITSTSLTSGNIFGSSRITLVGNGTVSMPASWTGSLQNSLDIKSTNTTFTGNFRYSAGTMKYIEGIVNTSNSTLVLTGSATLDTGSLEWGNITVGSLTLTLQSAFTCSGTFTVNTSGLTISGTGFWTRVGNLVFASSTITLNLPNNLTVTDTLITNSNITINNNSLLVASLSNSVGTISGTTTIVFNGTGTWSGTGILTNNTTINTTGTLTISGSVNYRTGTLTYTAGTVNSSAGTLVCTAASTLNTGGMTWTNITITGTQTLTSNLNVSELATVTGTATFVNAGRFTQTGSLRLLNTTTFTLINNITVLNTFIADNNGSTQTMNGFQIICNGGITTTGSSTGTTVGTTTILLNGTGTWTSASGSSSIGNSTTINTTGTITFSGSVFFRGATLTYTAGTVVTTGSRLSCLSSTTLNTAGISWDGVYFSSATITLSSVLTVTGNTLIAGAVTFVNTARLTQTGSLTLLDATTFTLINNLTVLGNITFTTNNLTQTINGFAITCGGGIAGTGTGTVTGTTPILLNGTGTWSGSARIRNNLTINTPGTITISGDVYFNTGTLTYVAGTVITAGSTLNCLLATTLNTAGVTWDNAAFSGSINLLSILNVTSNTTLVGFVDFVGVNRFTQTGSLTLTSAVDLTLINDITVLGNIITLAGDTTLHQLNGYTVRTSGLNLQGTQSSSLIFSQIILNGTGTWAGSTALLLGSLVFNTSGTISIVGDVYCNTISIQYLAGTVNTADSNLVCRGVTTFNTQGMSWGSVTAFANVSNVELVLNSPLTVSNKLVLQPFNTTGAAPKIVTLSGTSGATIGTLELYQTGANSTFNPSAPEPQNSVVLSSGKTYNVSNSFTCLYSNRLLKMLLKSSVPGQKAVLTLAPAASQDIAYLDVTDIDSSGGQKIWSFDAALSNTDNWQELTAAAANSGGSTISAGSSYTWVA